MSRRDRGDESPREFARRLDLLKYTKKKNPNTALAWDDVVDLAVSAYMDKRTSE